MKRRSPRNEASNGLAFGVAVNVSVEALAAILRKGSFLMKRLGMGAILAGLLFLSGCDYLPFGLTPLKDIAASPAQFEGREVRVKGKVKDITKVPLLDLKLFVLDDGSGEVTVVARESLPAVNETVLLKGVVESMAIMGGESIGVHLRETKRL